MTNEEPVLVVVGFGTVGSGSFGGFSSSSTKFSSFSKIIRSKRFQFRLQIKEIYAAFPISIVLFANPLK